MTERKTELKEELLNGVGGLYDILMEVVGRLERIEQALNNLPPGEENRIFTIEEARQYIGVSKSHLYKLTSNNLIPHYKPTGRKIYFEKRELDQWLLRNRVKTREEIESEAATG